MRNFVSKEFRDNSKNVTKNYRALTLKFSKYQTCSQAARKGSSLLKVTKSKFLQNKSLPFHVEEF